MARTDISPGKHETASYVEKSFIRLVLSPLSRIWYKYHPEADQDPEKMFKFSFPEFVRFLVNGTKEFADDDYVLRHRGVSYHWENYWAECPVCHNLTRSVSPHLNVDLVTTGTPLEHKRHTIK